MMRSSKQNSWWGQVLNCFHRKLVDKRLHIKWRNSSHYPWVNVYITMALWETPCLLGKSSINEPCSIAMLVYQRVHFHHIHVFSPIIKWLLYFVDIPSPWIISPHEIPAYYYKCWHLLVKWNRVLDYTSSCMAYPLMICAIAIANHQENNR